MHFVENLTRIKTMDGWKQKIIKIAYFKRLVHLCSHCLAFHPLITKDCYKSTKCLTIQSVILEII